MIRTPTVHRTFAALADPTRIDIVARLSIGSATVTELAEPFAMSLRAVLKHVSTLEDAGLVRTVKDGRVRRCELERERFDDASLWIDHLRQRWERRIDRLEDYLKETQP
jgi:DNA-binding transcriptional ArsR family regulator